MIGKSRQFPPLFIAACTFLCLGILLLFCVLLFLELPVHGWGWLLISISLTGFGTGEILNHPREHVPGQGVQEKTKTSFYRKRNACALGNLLDIAALILFFMGLSSLIA